MNEEFQLNYDSNSVILLNFCLAFIMFGVSLNIKKEDFSMIIKSPKQVFAGLIAQFLLLPAITFLLINFIEIKQGLALGLLLVAACPGGNISNFITKLANGNLALSVSLTAISTISSFILTPLNFTFWSGIYMMNKEGLAQFNLSFIDILSTLFTLTILPVMAGMLFSKYLPVIKDKIYKPIEMVSILIFASFVIVAFANNYKPLLSVLESVLFLVLIHNLLALFAGYFTGRIFQLPFNSIKTITIETGIQNSGLGLIIIFNFFGGNGEMAIIAAWWGIWHIISGTTSAYLLKKLNNA